jgi:NADH pyrophosphatase NudC (nudix superfamily)
MIPSPTPTETTAPASTSLSQPTASVISSPRQMPCPQCGHPMPDLKGGKASICTNCGYKDSCCY